MGPTGPEQGRWGDRSGSDAGPIFRIAPFAQSANRIGRTKFYWKFPG